MTTIKIVEQIILDIGKIAKSVNYDIYLVGGYVRDLLLENNTTVSQQDIDFSVLGNGVEFAKIVAEHYNTKIVIYENFGTALVPIGDYKIEFVGTRKEEYTSGSRNPIVTNGTLEDDLRRRDFTVNALAIRINTPVIGTNDEYEVIDLFNGLGDLENKILRTPLEPEITYKDDPLRMMRGARFAAKLSFRLDENSISAIKNNIERIKIITQERISDELMKLLSTPKPSIGFKLLFNTGLLEIILPELHRLNGVDLVKVDGIGYAHKNVFYHTLQVIDNIAMASNNVWLRFSGMMHDIAKPRTKKFIEGKGWSFHGHEELGAKWQERIFKRLRLPLKKKDYVEKLVRLHHRPMALVDSEVTDSAIRRLCVDAAEDLEDLFTLCRADITSKDPRKIQKYLRNYELVIEKIKDVKQKDKLREFQSPVKGEELMQLFSLPPSRKVGILKKAIEEAILDGRIKNDYQEALNYVKENKDYILANYQ